MIKKCIIGVLTNKNKTNDSLRIPTDDVIFNQLNYKFTSWICKPFLVAVRAFKIVRTSSNLFNQVSTSLKGPS